MNSRNRLPVESSKATTAILLANGLLAATSAQTAPASDNAEVVELPEFAVDAQRANAPSSPKFTAPLRDVPQTVVVIPNSVYSEQAATSLRDVLRNTPGITFQAGEGGGAPGDNLYIRGFGARNDVFVDGIRDPGVLTRDTFNVEQVEVAKGPSSAISGRGSTGGSVNQVTKTPRRTDRTMVQATYGSADYRRATLDTNQELSGSPVPGAFRLNAVWTDGGIPGRDTVENRNWGVAPSLALGLGTPTTVTLAYQHLSQENIPDYGLPGTLPTPAVDAGKTHFDLDWSNFYGLVARDYERIDADAATAIAEHAFGNEARLRNVTRYGRNRRDAVITPPRAAAASNAASDPGFDPAVPQIRRTDTKYQDRDDEILANQTNFTAHFDTFGIQHTAVVGAEFSREEQSSISKTDTFANGRPPVADLYYPDPYAPYTPSIVRTGAHTRAVANSGAVYAFDTTKLGERWELSGGARWEAIDTAYDSVATDGTVSRLARKDDMMSWRAGVVFKPAPNGSLYAAYGTSFNPAIDGNQGITLGSSGNNAVNLDPEKNHGLEAGTKWDLLRERLSLTAAIFRTEKTNARTTDANENTVLAGDQRVDGIEIGASGRITDDVSVFAGYSYMDSSVRSSGVPEQVDAALQYVPEQSFNLWATCRLPMVLTIGGGIQYIDGYFYVLPTSSAGQDVGIGTEYTLYNLMASYPVNDHLTLRLNLNNAGNKRYIDRGYRGHFIPGAGRTLLISAVLSF